MSVDPAPTAERGHTAEQMHRNARKKATAIEVLFMVLKYGPAAASL